MREDEKVALLQKLLRNSAGFENDPISSQRADAWNYYFQRPRGDEVNGRSGVVAGDVAASVHANLAQMLDAFSSDAIADYDSMGEGDEDQARLESDTVQYFVMKTQNGYLELAKAIHQALLLRIGVVKCWVDRFKQAKTRTFKNVEQEAAAQMAAQPGVEVLSYKDNEIRVRETRELKKFRAECVNAANFFYPTDWDSYDLQACPCVIERHVDTRSDLVRMGFSRAKVSTLKAYAQDRKADITAALPGAIVTQPANVGDTSLDLIEWYECYVLTDVDGDGIAERRRMAYVHNSAAILEDEPAALVPYAIGSVLINPATITGISIYDMLRQVQDEHTGLKRALYDNVNTVTKNRVAYLDGKVNPDDIGDGRTNNGIRVEADTGITDVRQAITAFQVPDNSGNVLANIEALKRERTEMGGAALELASGQMQIGGDRMGSQGLDRAYSVMEQLAAMMIKNIAATLIRSVFLISHETLRLNFSEPVSVKVGGKWKTPTPSEWQVRDSVTVRVGMSPGERARQASTLRTMLADQVQFAQMGMDDILVSGDKFYKTLMHWARVSDVPNPEQYYIDPESPEAIKAAQQKAAMRAAEDQARKNLMSQAIGMDQLRIAVDKFGADADRIVKVFDILMRTEETEAQIVGPAVADAMKLARGLANGGDKNGAGDDATGDAAAE